MYTYRSVTPVVLEFMEDFRIVMISGPRQSGKTTLSRDIAEKLGMDYYTFDDDAVRLSAQVDPALFVRQLARTPVVLDEIQLVPEIVRALKMSVDEVDQPGRFLLTGSADMFRMSTIKESLAGRMVSVQLYPFSGFEKAGRSGNIVDRLFDGEVTSLAYEPVPYPEMVQEMIRGGFPAVQGLGDRSRAGWFESYIEARIEKDLSLIRHVREGNRLEIKKLLTILAYNTSNLLKYASLAKHLRIQDVTVKRDIEMLEGLFLVRRVNPYFTHRGKREYKTPKLHFVDTGLVAHLLGADAEMLIMREREMLGNLVENFVYTELLKHTTYAQKTTSIFHYREAQYEVDLVLEQSDGSIVGIEVKASASLKPEFARGLLRLSHNAGTTFRAGYIFYGGDRVLPLTQEGVTFWCLPLSLLLGRRG